MSQELHQPISDRPKVRRSRHSSLFAGLLLSSLAGFSGASTAYAAAPTGTFEGNAYGTFSTLKAGTIASTLGFSAFIACPCRGTGGETLSNTVNSLSAGKNGKVLKANTILSTVFTNDTTSMAIVKNTSTIEGLNALNGEITADTVMAVANTTADGSTISSNADGSTFANLQIAGNAISADVPPNTTVDLPGIGNVVLKSEKTSGNGTSKGSIIVEMITINVTVSNSFGLPVGAHIIVAHARSGFTRLLPGAAIVSGRAWATSANAAIGDLLRNRIGLTAFVTMGCTGTNGKTLTNNIQELSVSPVLSLGTGVTTAFGGPTVSGADAKTTATLQSVGLLNGLISATTVTAVAETTIAGGVRTRSTTGSGFVGLIVLGIPVPGNVPPNTNITLPGIGFVILNEQIIPPASSNAETQVNGIHIFITTTNLLLLPVGAEVIVAHAAAGADNL